MKVFCVFGISKSGKTTTAEKIIGELRRRRYRVGSVKDIHNENFKLDTEGTNTWRHMNAGSQMVVARGLYETDVLIPQRREISDMLKWFEPDFDYVVIEGGREESFPKILTAKDYLEIAERMDETVFAVSGVISGQGDTADGIGAVGGRGDTADENGAVGGQGDTADGISAVGDRGIDMGQGIVAAQGIGLDIPVINALTDIVKLTDLIELKAQEFRIS